MTTLGQHNSFSLGPQVTLACPGNGTLLCYAADNAGLTCYTAESSLPRLLQSNGSELHMHSKLWEGD